MGNTGSRGGRKKVKGGGSGVMVSVTSFEQYSVSKWNESFVVQEQEGGKGPSLGLYGFWHPGGRGHP